MAARDIKVGIFVFLSLLLTGVVVFLIGDEAQLFARRDDLQVAFKDVQGLTRGSPVRMGGVDIGRVVSLGYGPESEDNTIYVRMSVVSSEARRIRKDSVARVEGKGLLGDKMIVITVGSQEAPPLQEGEFVRSEESQDLLEMVGSLKTTMSGVERVVENLEKATHVLAEEELHKDVKEAVQNLSGILRHVNEGEGYVGRLLRDPEEARRLSATIDNLRGSAAELEKLLASSRAVMDRVRTGPGFVHEVIYGQSGEKALAQVGGAAEELSLALKGIREGDSFAHSMLYDAESRALVDNLNQASEDFRLIVKDLREGKGTLGAFLSDPSVYEDLKVLLGNVGRNRSLRALVRYSIKKDEEAGRVEDGKEAQ